MTKNFTYVARSALAALAGAAALLSSEWVVADQTITKHAATTPIAAPPRLPAGGAPLSEAGTVFYARRWGVDHLSVRYVASGSMLEFRYRVVDPAKAQVLGDKRQSPELIDQKTGLRVRVPEVEQVGALRQQGKLEAGKEYWVLFPNPGKSVKPGERVDIVIGSSFHVNGLVVK